VKITTDLRASRWAGARSNPLRASISRSDGAEITPSMGPPKGSGNEGTLAPRLIEGRADYER